MDDRKRSTPCQYFVLGKCAKGESCAFSHDPNVAKPGGTGVACRDFINSAGRCRMGDKCIYVHGQPNFDGGAPVRERTVFYGKQASDGENEIVGLLGSGARVGHGNDVPGSHREQQAARGAWSQVARFPGQQNPPTLVDSPDSEGKGKPSSSEAKPIQPTLRSHVPCKFFFSTGCRAGESCRFSHDASDMTDASEHDESLTCGICMEPLQFRRIGVLSHCSHLFCYSCIKQWRSSDMADVDKTKNYVQVCPVCRTRSFFIAPSDAPFHSEEERLRIIDGFKQKCSQIPCKYGDDACPFGTSCLFKHNAVDPAKLNLRFLKTADGTDKALPSTVARFGDLILK